MMCAVCQKELQKRGKKTPRFCSGKCRLAAYRRRHKIRKTGKGWWIGVKTPSGWKALAGPFKSFLDAVEHTETRFCERTSAHSDD